MTKKPKTKKHENVEFQFMSLDEWDTAKGIVLVRDDQMIIDIQDKDGATLYLIVGKPNKHFFTGVNSAGPIMPKVQAKWVSLSRRYLGYWVEDGHEYLFSFELDRG